MHITRLAIIDLWDQFMMKSAKHTIYKNQFFCYSLSCFQYATIIITMLQYTACIASKNVKYMCDKLLPYIKHGIIMYHAKQNRNKNYITKRNKNCCRLPGPVTSFLSNCNSMRIIFNPTKKKEILPTTTSWRWYLHNKKNSQNNSGQIRSFLKLKINQKN